jgi:hypothetical protein
VTPEVVAVALAVVTALLSVWVGTLKWSTGRLVADLDATKATGIAHNDRIIRLEERDRGNVLAFVRLETLVEKVDGKVDRLLEFRRINDRITKNEE